MNWNYKTYITIGVYIGLFIALIFAFTAEREDLYCPQPGSDVCFVGNGAAYAQGIPNGDDNLVELLTKLKILARYENSSVTWRRCLIFSIIAGILIPFLILRRPPNGPELLMAMFALYILCYLMYEFYKRHLTKPALVHIDTTIHTINKKIKYRKRTNGDLII